MRKPSRLKAVLAIILAMTIAAASFSAYAGPGAGFVTADLLNVRKEPNQDSEVVAKLAREDEFSVLDIKGEWYQIRFGESSQGWVMAQYVKATFEVAQINSDGVNARSEPSTEANVLQKMDSKDKYFVIGSFNNWFKIKLATGETAWVNDEFAVVVGTATRGYDDGLDTRAESTIGNVSEPPKPTSKMEIKGDNVNFREQPALDAEIIDALAEGSVVTVLEGAGEWRRVKTQSGDVGYINKMFLAQIKVEQVAVSGGGGGSGKSVVDAAKPAPKKTTTTANKEANAKGSDGGDTSSGQGGGDLVSYAKQFLGIRYKWGGTTTKGFDCSGYTQYVMRHFGVSIPRTSKEQAKAGTAVSKENLRVGDIIYFAKSGSNRTVNHVGIYIGGGSFIHSSSGGGGKGVTVSSLGSGSYSVRYAGARRYLK